MNKRCTATIVPAEPAKAFVGDDGIYVPSRHDFMFYEMLISKELFIEAYNKWIKNDVYVSSDRDDADDWCE